MFICTVTNLGGWIANVLTKVGIGVTFDLDMVVLAIIGIINVL